MWHSGFTRKAKATQDVCAHIDNREIAERGLPSPTPFDSIQTLSVSDGAYPHWGEPFALLGPLIQMLISSGNFLTDTPTNNV